MSVLGYLAVCCLAVVALAMPAHAIERAASLPYVYEITKGFPKCGWEVGATTGQVLTTNASGVMHCVTVGNTGTKTEIPNCTVTQYLGVEGGKLMCKTISAVCGTNEVLNKIDNDTFSCTSLSTSAVTKAPQCKEEEVLQGDGNKTLSCVNIGALALPKCAAGEVITNLGGAVQCVDTVKSRFPTNCGAGQALTVENGKFVCTTFNTGMSCAAGTMALLNKGVTYCVATSCAENERLTFSAGKPICKDLPVENNVAPTCSGADLWASPLSFMKVGGNFSPYLTSDEIQRVKAYRFASGEYAFIPDAAGNPEKAYYTGTNFFGGRPTSVILKVASHTSTMVYNPNGTMECDYAYRCTGRTGWESVANCATNTANDIGR